MQTKVLGNTRLFDIHLRISLSTRADGRTGGRLVGRPASAHTPPLSHRPENGGPTTTHSRGGQTAAFIP